MNVDLPKPIQEIFTLKEVADLLKISHPNMRKLVREGKITGMQVNTGQLRKHYRFTKADIEAFLAKK